MELLADRYELGDVVGAGGMARVVQAHDRLLERPVAVKLLREDMAADPATRDRFLREARTAAQFNHPNAVAVFDCGQDDGEPWIVMELVAGEDLAQRLRTFGPLPENEAVAIADAVLSALGAAHAESIVHRDVKPANVMLLDDGSVKLADFGIAKSLADASTGLTATGQVVGTARYLSPEQVTGTACSPASDVYAMGIVLYEMLVGRAPYTGTDPVAVARAHISEPVPEVRADAPAVSAGLAAVIEHALAKDPAERYADADQMRAALHATPHPALVLGRHSVAPARERTDTLVLSDTPTLITAGVADGTRRRPSWFLLGLVGAALLTVAALLGLSAAVPEPAADEAPPAAVEEPAVEEPEADPPRAPRDNREADEREAEPGPKGKGNGKGKGHGKKD